MVSVNPSKPILAGLAAYIGSLAIGFAAEPVSVELALPSAKTHVIGDIIPLQWKFRNHSEKTLAFMWEGCCRLNGRVEMKREGPPKPPPAGVRPSHSGYGPGIYNPSCLHCRLSRQQSEMTAGNTPQGPALAHIFAKAVKLTAGETENLPSRLDSWVLLEQTGDYKLTGHYLGVHPRQQPQMPKGTQLWTGRANSPVIDLSLLSVEDYLTERPARTSARGIALKLTGPIRIRPFEPMTLQLEFANHSTETQSINWPGQFDFWLVDDKGRRLPESQYALSRFGKPLSIAPGKTEPRDIIIRHDLVEGRPFGKYLAFVELRETTNTIRVPSNPIHLQWNIDQSMTDKLIRQAANHPPIGARNPPLKLLRLHLSDLANHLTALPTDQLIGKSGELLAELKTASTLKKLQPTPGRVDLNILIPDTGSPMMQDIPVQTAFRESTPSLAEQIATVVNLRRHLGWSIGISVRLTPDSPLSGVRQITTAIASVSDKLAAPPATKVFNSTATSFSTIQFRSQPVAANFVIRLEGTTGSFRTSYAVKTAPADAAANERYFLPESVATLTFHPSPDVAELVALLPPSPAVLILADERLNWSDVLRAAARLIDRGLLIDLKIL